MIFYDKYGKEIKLGSIVQYEKFGSKWDKTVSIVIRIDVRGDDRTLFITANLNEGNSGYYHYRFKVICS